MLVLPARVAVLAATGNAVVMAVLAVTAPIGWVFLPGVAAASARPRVAALVAAWTAMLIIASIMVPFTPGHRNEGWALGFSAGYLALLPALSWLLHRPARSDRHHAEENAP
jgi:hypothetical protein